MSERGAEGGEAASERRRLGAVRRVVVKLGSALVVSEHFAAIVDAVRAQRAAGVEVAVVSSGAVAVGMEQLGIAQRPTDLADVQALAAVGQAALVGRYDAELRAAGTRCAQILLTHQDLSDRRHFLNIRHTLESTLAMGLVPLVNENDTVATEELRFGDNDRLAGAVATLVDADLVVLLSDVDALYDADPGTDPAASPIREVDRIDERIRARAGDARSGVGTGGMSSKLAAAELATGAGIPLLVASGREVDVLPRLLAGEPLGTRFHPPARRVPRRRHWIGFLSRVRGRIHVDGGAVRALREQGSSLLAIGIERVEGRFARGDAVAVLDPEGVEVARGLVAYDAEELSRIAGHRSHAIPERLGKAGAGPVVHRNDLLLTGEPSGVAERSRTGEGGEG